MQDSTYSMAALGVAGAFLLVAFSALATKNARYRGIGVGMSVVLGAPAFSVIGVIIGSLVARVPTETRARGGGFAKPGPDGVLHVGGLLAGLAIVLGAVATTAYVARNVLDVTGEPLQTSVVRALMISGFVAGL